MSITTPITASITARIGGLRDRRDARRRFAVAEAAAEQLHADLLRVAEPRARAGLLSHLADAYDALSGLRTRAFGGRTSGLRTMSDPDTLAAISGLYALASSAEWSVAEASWTPVEDLQAGQPIWFAGEYGRVLEVTEAEPAVFTVVFQLEDLGDGSGGITRLQWDAGEHIRTGGVGCYGDLEVSQIAEDMGVGGDELSFWRSLATTYDRDHRATIYQRLHGLAAARVGLAAAQVLADLAAGETHLMLPADPMTDRGDKAGLAGARAVIGTAFFALGVTIALAGLLPGLPASERLLVGMFSVSTAAAAATGMHRLLRQLGGR